MATRVNQVITLLGEENKLEDSNLISASIGIALYPDDGVDVRALLSNADKALVDAKKNAKGKYIFSSNLSEDSTGIETSRHI